MKVRRKSLWRGYNNKQAKFRANQRAAKERKRLARLARDEPEPDLSHAPRPRAAPALFTITIRCRDGQRAVLRIADGPFGLTPSATATARKIATILRFYRPTNHAQTTAPR